MPLICEGPPGPPGTNCPGNKRGKEVKLVRDIPLCNNCTLVRFPPGYRAEAVPRRPQGLEILTTEQARISVPPVRPSVSGRREGLILAACPYAPLVVTLPNVTTQIPSDVGLIISELLCFVTNKISTMPYDMLLKLCTDF
jgi:hypothetical protein